MARLTRALTSGVVAPLDEELDNSLVSISADGKTARTNVLSMVVATEATSEHRLAKAISMYGKKLFGLAQS